MNEKPIVDLDLWMLTGNLSGVFPGETKEGVLEKLGTPRGWGSTETVNNVELMDADVWGYGIWALFFEEGVLDAVTCAVHALKEDEDGWYFEVNENISSCFYGMDDMEKLLSEKKVSFRRFCNDYYDVRNNITGEVINVRRRLNHPTLLIGEQLRTRMVFGSKDGALSVIGGPFNFRRQVLSYKKLDPVGAYELLN